MNVLYAKIRYHLKRILINIFCKLGFRNYLLRERSGHRILLYHGIDKEGRTDLNGRYLSVDRFEKQIQYLKKQFNIVSLNDLFEGRTDSNKFNIAITFDDGYQNNLDLAIPILERYQVPATFFITAITATDFPMLWADYLDLSTYLSVKPIEIDGVQYSKKEGAYLNAKGQDLKKLCKQNDWRFKQKIYTAFPEASDLAQTESLKIYWQQLSPTAIKQLDAYSGMSIGVHAYVHDNLGRLPVKEAVDNLHKAKAYLEGIVQHPINTLAYADGSYSPELLEAVEKIGFDEQYAVDYLFPEDIEDKRILDRLTINPFTSLEHQIYAILKGKY